MKGNGEKYSPPCDIKGCVDYNLKIVDGINAYNEANGTKFDGMVARDVSVFHLGDGIMGKTQIINCGCELRGGGNLISPLHIHYCEQHSGTAGRTAEVAELFLQIERAVMGFAPKLQGELAGKLTALDKLEYLRQIVR